MLAAVGGFHFAPIRFDISPGLERAGVTVSKLTDEAGCEAGRTRSAEALRWRGCRLREVLKVGEISSCETVSSARRAKVRATCFDYWCGRGDDIDRRRTP